MEENQEATEKATTKEVLEALVDMVPEEDLGFERCQIMRARDRYYIAKFYAGLDDEYEAYHLDLT